MFGEVSSGIRVCLLFVLVLQSVDDLQAQDKLLPIFRFQKVEGIFNGQIRSRVVRDQEGFTWVGTLNGLERFDGYSVKDYRNVVDDPHSLSSNNVLSLLLDSKGRLWVGTFDAGVSLYDRGTDRFFNLYPQTGDSSWYQAKTILGMMEDHNGDIWIASRNEGVVWMELPSETDLPPDSLLKSIRFTTYALGTPRNSATSLFEQTDGKIVVASDSGLLLLDHATRSISRPNLPMQEGHLLDHAVVQCLRRDSGDVFWAGSDTEGLFRVNLRLRNAQNFRHADGDPLSILSNNVQDVAIWEGGLIWLGTGEGLQLFSPADGRGVPYLVVGPNPSTKTWSTMLYVDRTGTLWVGTAGGECTISASNPGGFRTSDSRTPVASDPGCFSMRSRRTAMGISGSLPVIRFSGLMLHQGECGERSMFSAAENLTTRTAHHSLTETGRSGTVHGASVSSGSILKAGR